MRFSSRRRSSRALVFRRRRWRIACSLQRGWSKRRKLCGCGRRRLRCRHGCLTANGRNCGTCDRCNFRQHSKRYGKQKQPVESWRSGRLRRRFRRFGLKQRRCKFLIWCTRSFYCATRNYKRLRWLLIALSRLALEEAIVFTVFEFQLCYVKAGSSLTFSTTIPMIFLGIVLRKVKPLSTLGIRTYFLIVFLFFTVWGVVAVKLICQSNLTPLNVLLLALWGSVGALIAPLLYHYREFRRD